MRGLDLRMIFAAALYACSIAVFSLVRVFVWTDRSVKSDWGVVVVQFLLFLVPGLLLFYKNFSADLIFIAGGTNFFIVIGYYFCAQERG